MDADNSGLTASQRVIGTPFPKGFCGNKGGRPKGYAEFCALCREHSHEAVATLVGALGEGGMVAVAAAAKILEYGWGKPKQEVEVNGSVGAARMDITRLSDEDLKRARAIALIASVDSDG